MKSDKNMKCDEDDHFCFPNALKQTNKNMHSLKNHNKKWQLLTIATTTISKLLDKSDA